MKGKRERSKHKKQQKESSPSAILEDRNVSNRVVFPVSTCPKIQTIGALNVDGSVVNLYCCFCINFLAFEIFCELRS